MHCASAGEQAEGPSTAQPQRQTRHIRPGRRPTLLSRARARRPPPPPGAQLKQNRLSYDTNCFCSTNGQWRGCHARQHPRPWRHESTRRPHRRHGSNTFAARLSVVAAARAPAAGANPPPGAPLGWLLAPLPAHVRSRAVGARPALLARGTRQGRSTAGCPTRAPRHGSRARRFARQDAPRPAAPQGRARALTSATGRPPPRRPW